MPNPPEADYLFLVKIDRAESTFHNNRHCPPAERTPKKAGGLVHFRHLHLFHVKQCTFNYELKAQLFHVKQLFSNAKLAENLI